MKSLSDAGYIDHVVRTCAQMYVARCIARDANIAICHVTPSTVTQTNRRSNKLRAETTNLACRLVLRTSRETRGPKMERNLVKTLDDTHDKEGIIGCILADHAGLCLGVKGDASSDSAGLIAAIADLVAKLEPKSGSPIISLQNDNKNLLEFQAVYYTS
ncbi:PREDICTED: uncharacterized protein LOC108747247 isoform X2 [Trachymyrmex septentrionalis]|uniref:uncharacterized protein LOC108747247 isoform X2 n=2 Tax=Trachymyrmex TaxID=34717 RepID=UPI00084F4F1D|nr:PREDICTED: uncharacterized protein LOC108747247 isoform X2 [Trachymyrmex septentrionalis]